MKWKPPFLNLTGEGPPRSYWGSSPLGGSYRSFNKSVYSAASNKSVFCFVFVRPTKFPSSGPGYREEINGEFQDQRGCFATVLSAQKNFSTLFVAAVLMLLLLSLNILRNGFYWSFYSRLSAVVNTPTEQLVHLHFSYLPAPAIYNIRSAEKSYTECERIIIGPPVLKKPLWVS